MDAKRPILADGQLQQTIVLVGLMGAGKSTVGRRLAAALGVDFVDSDDAIEQAAGMTIAEIFERLGQAHFRDGERRVLARLLKNPPHVLATGGGAFVSPENRDIIKQSAVSVWINADLETLWERVKGRAGRPLLQNENPKGVLSDLMEQRRPAYEQADFVVHSKLHNSHEIVVQDIIDLMTQQSEASHAS